MEKILITNVNFSVTKRRSGKSALRSLDTQGFERGYVGKSDQI
jgi:hypothetical protein